jgi:hypothetical protein
MLGRGGEGAVAGIARPLPRRLPDRQTDRPTLLLAELLPLLLALSGQDKAQVIGGAAAGGAVRLVDDDGETAVAQALLAEDVLLRVLHLVHLLGPSLLC